MSDLSGISWAGKVCVICGQPAVYVREADARRFVCERDSCWDAVRRREPARMQGGVSFQCRPHPANPEHRGSHA